MRQKTAKAYGGQANKFKKHDNGIQASNLIRLRILSDFAVLEGPLCDHFNVEIKLRSELGTKMIQKASGAGKSQTSEDLGAENYIPE